MEKDCFHITPAPPTSAHSHRKKLEIYLVNIIGGIASLALLIKYENTCHSVITIHVTLWQTLMNVSLQLLLSIQSTLVAVLPGQPQSDALMCYY